MKYKPTDYSALLGMKGFSDQLLNDHFGLYQGYVSSTNELLEKLKSVAESNDPDSAEHAELRRRLGWEFNGMRLHELYFGNLGGDGRLPSSGALPGRIASSFGSVRRWAAEFRTVAGMRGVGWAILYYDAETERLMNFWIDEHDRGHAAGGSPLLVMDVWEHAFMTDYGTDRDSYIESFMANIDWKEVERRMFVAHRAEVGAR